MSEHGPSDESPFDVTPDSDDVIGSPEPAARRGRASVLFAMVAVIALVLAGGAFALVGSKNTQASSLTKLVPAGAYGYLQLDLAQSSSVGLYEYLSHLPGSPATKPDAHKATFRDSLLQSVFSDSQQINYGRDVQPWLGDSAGIAVFRGPDGAPTPIAVIASTDAAKAKAGLARIRQTQPDFAYDIVDGDVLIGQHQADLDSAESQAKDGSLPSAANYAADVATLPKGSLVTMWADLDKITSAAKSALAKTCASGTALAGGCGMFGGLTGLGGLGGLGGSFTSGGRVALGITVANTVATLTVRELGHKAVASTASVADEIQHLPAGTTGAIALGNVSSGVTAAMKSLSTLTGALTGASGVQAFSGSASAAASAAAFAPALPSLQPAAPSAEASTGTGLGSPSTGSYDPTQQITDAIKSATGLTFPGDFTAMLGDRVVLAVGRVPLQTSKLAQLQVGLRSHPADVGKAQQLGQQLASHLATTGLPFKVSSETAGSDFVLADDPAWATALAADGGLGTAPQFVAATGDLSQAHFVAYVDLTNITDVFAATKEKALSGFKALGIVERTDGGDAVIQLKLIAG